MNQDLKKASNDTLEYEKYELQINNISFPTFLCIHVNNEGMDVHSKIYSRVGLRTLCIPKRMHEHETARLM